MVYDLLIKGGKLVITGQGVVEGTLAIKHGKIAAIMQPIDVPEALEVIDAQGKYVLPGVIEAHAYYGRGALLEDYASETCSAALGGVTTVITYVACPHDYDGVYHQLRQAGEERSYIDFSFHFSLMVDGNLERLEHYARDFGVSSFMFYMGYKGEEGRLMGLLGCDDGLMHEGFTKIAHIPKGLACVHCENVEVIDRLKKPLREQGREDLIAWAEARPSFTEAESIQRALYFGRLTDCPVYIVNLSSKQGLDMVKEWRQKYDHFFVETCPQYLTHTMFADEGKLAKVSPPLRTEADVEALWRGLKEGYIDTVASDHVAYSQEQKLASIWDSPPGFPGSATLLSVLLSEGIAKRGLSIERVAELTSSNVAKIFNLFPRKGALMIGSDADFTIVDLELERRVDAKDMLSSSEVCIYDGYTLKGWPVQTIVRGHLIMEDGKIIGKRGYGKYVGR